MKNILLTQLSTIIVFTMLPYLACGQDMEWPVLKHYDQDHINKIALPVGGIGTGTISLGGIGDLRDWEIMNKPAKGFVGTPTGNRAPFFAIYAHPEGESAKTRALMGPVDINQYESKEGRGPNNHGLPRFRTGHSISCPQVRYGSIVNTIMIDNCVRGIFFILFVLLILIIS